MICGKGGCGKSTLTVLLARALAGTGEKVLVADADESNLCLHRFLGARQPEIMMDAMGGVVSRNRRKFRHPNSSPATSISKSIILPSLWKV